MQLDGSAHAAIAIGIQDSRHMRMQMRVPTLVRGAVPSHHRECRTQRLTTRGIHGDGGVAARVQECTQEIGRDVRGTGPQRPDTIEDFHRYALLIRVFQGPDSNPGTLLGSFSSEPCIGPQSIGQHERTVAREGA